MKRKSSSPPIRDLIVVSDLHCGSSCALMPPEFVTHEGQTVQANAIQRWFWQQWCELQAWSVERTDGRPFALLVNGDLIEGDHHRTKEVVSVEVADHIEIAVQCLTPFADMAAALFVVEGTECHTTNAEHGIAKRMNAVGPNGTNGAWRRFDATIAGVRVIAQHHIGTASRTWTESTGVGSALANEQVEAVRAGETPPSVLFSAHRHRPGLFQTSSGISGVTGAWQALTRHGRKVVPSARCWPSALHARFEDGAALPIIRQFDRRPPEAPSIVL